MATTNELIDWTWQHLGWQTTLYPAEEVVANGLNPAQRLLCMLSPQRQVSRVLLSLQAQESCINLRTASPTAWKPLRIVPGDVRTEVTSGGWGERDLPMASLHQVCMQRRWWRDEGKPRHWVWVRPHWLILHPRPSVASTWTLISAAMPPTLDVTIPAQECGLSMPLHPLVAEVAAALLLCKESGLEMQKALGMLNRALGLELAVPSPRYRRERREVAS